MSDRRKLTEEGLITIHRLEAEGTYRDSKMVVVVDAGETKESAELTKQQILNDNDKVPKLEEEINDVRKMQELDYNQILRLQKLTKAYGEKLQKINTLCTDSRIYQKRGIKIMPEELFKVEEILTKVSS